jgi:peptidoglycan/xylan/chitin deacetylase (PgdA/CDA1 family)
MQLIKNIIKKAIYHLGILSHQHNKDNKETLTVLLFHRVLPVDDVRWLQADMDWTVSDVFFRDCLGFFKKHYNPVSEQDIQDFFEKDKALPDKALLITFDDGWSDNHQYAMNILKEFDIKPLLFVTTDAIGQHVLSWQETLYSAWRINLLTDEIVENISEKSAIDLIKPKSERDIREFVSQLQNAGNEVKDKMATLCKPLAESFPGEIQMMNTSQLKALYENGFAMGTHGTQHEPYTQIEDPQQNMEQARDDLSAMLGADKPLTMSFPHGRVNDDLIACAKNAGYKGIYTGHEVLNKLVKKDSSILGRFNIEQGDLEDTNGRLLPELLALYLFRREIKTLDRC